MSAPLGAPVGRTRADAQRARSTTTHGRSRRGGAGGTRRARAERTDGTFRRDFSKGLFLFCKEVSVTCTCGWRSHRAASLHKFIIICYVRPGQYALFHLKLLPTEHMVHIYTHSVFWQIELPEPERTRLVRFKALCRIGALLTHSRIGSK